MTKLDFFTPITYSTPQKSFASSLLEKVDHYFLNSGKTAYVIQGITKNGQEKVILSNPKNSQSSLLKDIVITISYFTLIIPLLVLITKTVLRLTHKFKVIDPKLKLEKGMNVSDQTATKIKELLPKILEIQNDPEVQWLSKGNNLVFKLVQEPQLVFKIAKPVHYEKPKSQLYLPQSFFGMRYISTKTKMNRAISQRFENMVKAKETCLVEHLNLLTIPQAKKMILTAPNEKTYYLIVEKSLDFQPDSGKQEELFENHSKQLNETVRQLATFVAKTGFNDVTWRNIPVLNETPNFPGPRRIALIDLEHLENKVNGFIGDPNNSCGLIRCVSAEQIDIVLAEANKQNVNIPVKEKDEAKNKRLKAIEEAKELRLFYEKKGILTGKEPIDVDLNTMGVNLLEERLMFPEDNFGPKLKMNLENYILTYINCVNEHIQNGLNDLSMKSRRYFKLSEKDLVLYYHGKPYKFPSSPNQKNVWLPKMIDSLIDKGYFFKLDKVEEDQYYIQA